MVEATRQETPPAIHHCAKAQMAVTLAERVLVLLAVFQKFADHWVVALGPGPLEMIANVGSPVPAAPPITTFPAGHVAVSPLLSFLPSVKVTCLVTRWRPATPPGTPGGP